MAIPSTRVEADRSAMFPITSNGNIKPKFGRYSGLLKLYQVFVFPIHYLEKAKAWKAFGIIEITCVRFLFFQFCHCRLYYFTKKKKNLSKGTRTLVVR